jgi:cytochrome c-type biogenesis protein
MRLPWPAIDDRRARWEKDLAHAGLTTLGFGLGAALPLLLVGLLLRQLLFAWRGKMMRASHGLKAGLGLVLIFAGSLVLTGMDKAVETLLVNASPEWLTKLTTQY